VREFNCKAGISKSFTGLTKLRSAWFQAGAALRLGHNRDPHLWVYDFSGYTLEYVLERAASEIPAEYLLHPAAVTLRNLDRNTGTAYIKTLRYYLDCRCNMSRAAEKLFIHRTSLIRRLERITDITSLDLDQPGEIMTLAVSLYLLADSGSGEAADPLV
jgi:sugar diacid utilization regulator